jgi:hypothetical protein
MEPWTVLKEGLLSPFEMLSLLEQSVRDLRQESATLREDDPEYAETVKALILALFEHYDLTEEAASFQEATSLAHRLIASSSQLDPQILMHWSLTVATRIWVPEVPLDEPGLPSRATMHLASNQAAIAIANNDAPGALEELEQNRAQMLSTALNIRRELENLRRADPDLAEKLIDLRERALTAIVPGMTGRPEEIAIEQVRALANEMGELVLHSQIM